MKRLTKLLVGGAALVGLTFGQQYQAKNTDKINVFKQPNDSTLAYYGSGDVNQDNQLNWADYNKMVAEAPQIDEADLNGNGIPSDPQDIQLATDYFNGNIKYLPAQWNKLETREERIDWVDKMLAIDQTDTITYSSPNKTSGHIATQLLLNLAGHKFNSQEEKEFVSEIYDTTNIGRFNIPIYHNAYFNIYMNATHGMNFCFTGVNVTNPEEHSFVEPQAGYQNDIPDIYNNINPLPGSNFLIQRLKKVNLESQGLSRFLSESLISYEANDNSEVILKDFLNPNLIEIREQAMDETYPYLTLTAPENSSLQNSKQTQISISGADEHFDRLGFSLNGSDTTWTSATSDTSFYVNSEEGNNELLAIAEDKAGNQTLEKRVYEVDSSYVGVEDEQSIPQGYSLEQNYPNPFNPTTTIEYALPREEHVNFTIYDITGKKVKTLSDKKMPAGTHEIYWNPQDKSAGVYIGRVQAGDYVKTQKLTYLK